MSQSYRYKRAAYHAGSWYTNSPKKLNQEISDYLLTASQHEPKSNIQPNKTLKCLIAPHPGLSYGGQTAAFAYNAINPNLYKRIFILGPSHKFYHANLFVSNASHYQTPLGDFEVDSELIQTFLNSQPKNQNTKREEYKFFGTLSQDQDEDEHSLEMQLPFLAKIFDKQIKEKSVKVVPIIVGDLDRNSVGYNFEMYSKLLLPYFQDPSNLFVISSDFCHWGQRFGFTSYYKNGPEPNSTTALNFPSEIYKGIEAMDKHAMEMISQKKGAYDSFYNYMKSTKNTICGRNPILLVLKMNEMNGEQLNMDLLRYSQSSKVQSERDSSVSYAAAVGY